MVSKSTAWTGADEARSRVETALCPVKFSTRRSIGESLHREEFSFVNPPTPDEGRDPAADQAHDESVHADTSFLGHPRGLAALFNLEMWERFSFLGFQAILALYFADSIAHGGLGYSQQTASSVVAAYGALVYLLSMAGAWVADRLAGTYRSVLWGAVVITAGHVCMGIPVEATTWIGLALIVLGTGLLKPNVATMVGELYARGDQRRDAGFSIYYSGINVGAFLGPLVAGWLGQKVQWHVGFLAAAVGMVLGLLLYVRGRRQQAASTARRSVPEAFRPDRNFLILVGLIVAAVVVGIVFAVASDDGLSGLVNVITVVTAIIPIAFFVMMYRSKKVAHAERRNLMPYALLLIALIAYNLTYFQTGSTLNFMALERTHNTIGSFEYPSTWYISLTAIVEIVMGPVLALLWVRMGRRQPGVAVKVGLGTVLGGVSFLVVAAGAAVTPALGLISSVWIIVCYVFLGLGDLILQTSGMSATTKLAPRAFASQTMALWFAAMALSQGIQAQIVKLFTVQDAPVYFGVQGVVILAYGVVLMALAPWMSRRMQQVA